MHSTNTPAVWKVNDAAVLQPVGDLCGGFLAVTAVHSSAFQPVLERGAIRLKLEVGDLALSPAPKPG